MNQPGIVTLSTRIYTTLLILYPVAWRSAYGAHMVQVFQDVCRDSYRRQGIAGIVFWWCSTLPDLILTAIEQRKEGKLTMSKSNPPIKGSGLGIMCIAGGLFYAFGGLWLSVAGVPTDPFGIQLTNLLKMMWPAGTVCSLMGMAVLGAMDSKPVSWIAGWVSGFVLSTITLEGLVGIILRSSVSPFSGSAFPFSVISGVVPLISWGVLTAVILNARRWTNWTRFAPVVTLVAPFIGFLFGNLLGITYLPVIVMGLALAISGLAIQTHLNDKRRTLNTLSPAV